MKNIEIDEELYQYIASNTQYIGESASSIIRRLLAVDFSELPVVNSPVSADVATKNSSTNDSVSESSINESNASKGSTGPDIDSVFNYINKEELAMQRGAVGRFLLILSALHRVHKDSFSVVCEIRGRDRLYFAASESALAESGSSTKPRQIPDSPYWVITNSNTTRKKMMLTEAARGLGYSDTDTESIRELL